MNRRPSLPFAWRARLAACLVALWVVFGPKLASAATLVPMCGEHAETVIAPPVSRPASDAAMRAPCAERTVLGVSDGLPERQPGPVAPNEAFPRVLPIYYRLAPVPRTRIALAIAAGEERAAHGSGVERPPRRAPR